MYMEVADFFYTACIWNLIKNVFYSRMQYYNNWYQTHGKNIYRKINIKQGMR